MANTSHYGFTLFEGSDHPTWLTDWNNTITAIDNALYRIATGGGDLPDLTEVVARLQALEGRVDSDELRLNVVEGDIVDILSSLSTVSSDLSALATRVTTAESDIDTLETAVNTTLPAQIQTINDSITGILSSISSLDTRVTALETSSDSEEVFEWTLSDYIYIKNNITPSTITIPANSIVMCTGDPRKYFNFIPYPEGVDWDDLSPNNFEDFPCDFYFTATWYYAGFYVKNTLSLDYITQSSDTSSNGMAIFTHTRCKLKKVAIVSRQFYIDNPTLSFTNPAGSSKMYIVRSTYGSLVTPSYGFPKIVNAQNNEVEGRILFKNVFNILPLYNSSSDPSASGTIFCLKDGYTFSIADLSVTQDTSKSIIYEIEPVT